MTAAQRLWWEQAKSDLARFDALRKENAPPCPQCHLLHYLEMATEKLGKAYFWRSGKVPPKSHVGFVRFLKALLDRRQAELELISNAFGFKRVEDFESWVKSIQPLAYSLQKMAPAEAGNNQNPEYPWPHEAPIYCPAAYEFPLWTSLSKSGQGRKFLLLIEKAVAEFDRYA